MGRPYDKEKTQGYDVLLIAEEEVAQCNSYNHRLTRKARGKARKSIQKREESNARRGLLIKLPRNTGWGRALKPRRGRKTDLVRVNGKRVIGFPTAL